MKTTALREVLKALIRKSDIWRGREGRKFIGQDVRIILEHVRRTILPHCGSELLTVYTGTVRKATDGTAPKNFRGKSYLPDRKQTQ